jgi:hypothetical protein
LLFPLTFSKDFLQALSFNSHASAGSLGHLLREFDPVHSHSRRIGPSWSRWPVFLKGRDPTSRKGSETRGTRHKKLHGSGGAAVGFKAFQQFVVLG